MTTLVNQFKDHFERKHGISIDFRKQYGCDLGLCELSSDLEEKMIKALYEWAHEYIAENKDKYPHFEGWTYNLSMECNKLRTSKLSHLVNDVCHTLHINSIGRTK